MALTIRTFTTILKSLKDRVVARTHLTDLLETSDLFLLLAAIAREIEKVYLEVWRLLNVVDLSKCTGSDLDEWGKRMNPVKITRRAAVAATSTVIFSRAGTVGTITISSGTQVKTLAVETGTEYTFTTTGAPVQILDGFTDSAPADILADGTGTAYNVAADAIKAFVSKPSGVDTVTNPSKVTNGFDVEMDDQYRARMIAYMKSLAKSTIYAIEGAIYGLADAVSGKTVEYCKVVEDEYYPGSFVCYIDDGNGTAESLVSVAGESPMSPPTPAIGGEVDIILAHNPIKDTAAFTLYVNGFALAPADFTINYASGHCKLTPGGWPTGLVAGDVVTYDATYYDGLIAECQKVLDGDPLDRTNYPGLRAAGTMGQVESPQIQWQTIIANVTVLTGFTQATVIAAAKSVIVDYINSLDVGDDVIWAELVERIMAVSGVYDVAVTRPAMNVPIADYYLARTNTGLVTVT